VVETPLGTVVLAGTARAGLLLEIVTIAAAGAGLDRVTMQSVLAPTASFVDAHAIDSSLGSVDSVSVAVCEEVPKVAVMLPVVSLVKLPMLAAKDADTVPAAMLKLTGVVISEELSEIAMVVAVAGGCEIVTVQVLVIAGVTASGPHTSEVTVRDATRETVVTRDDPLYDAVTEPL
jgi:hypothetical protein